MPTHSDAAWPSPRVPDDGADDPLLDLWDGVDDGTDDTTEGDDE